MKESKLKEVKTFAQNHTVVGHRAKLGMRLSDPSILEFNTLGH